MIQFNDKIERHLRVFKNSKIDTEQTDFEGPALADPEVYPEAEIESDLQAIDERISEKDKRIVIKEGKYEKLLEKITQASSQRRRRHLAQKAGNLQREIDKLEQDCDTLFVKRSVISGIRHVRSKFDGLDIDLSFDDALDTDRLAQIESELETYLLEQGFDEEGLKGIMETLDMELQRDDDEHLESSDAYTEKALKEAQELEANEELDGTDDPDEESDTETNSGTQSGTATAD